TQAPRNHIGVANAQTRFETACKKSRDPPLSEVNTSRSGEDIMEHSDDFTDFVPPTPHDSPLLGGYTPGSDEEEAQTTQDKVITRLKLRVMRLEKKRKPRTSQPMKRRLFKGRVETSTDKSLGKDASKQERNDDKIEELNLTDGADTKVIVKDNGSGEKEETMDPEIFSTKYLIVDWESQNLGNVDMEDLHFYKIIRANGNISYHKSLSSMLRKFDRQGLVDFHRLVMKRFEDNTPKESASHAAKASTLVETPTATLDLNSVASPMRFFYKILNKALPSLLHWILLNRMSSASRLCWEDHASLGKTLQSLHALR
nr:hypothetical protein [Tanacetum cinerariifolium]